MEYARVHVIEHRTDEELLGYEIEYNQFSLFMDNGFALPQEITPLFRAAVIHHLGDVEAYIDRKPDMRFDGNHLALYAPALSGSVDLARLFAKSNYWDGLVLAYGPEHESAQQLAKRLGHLEVAEILASIEDRSLVEKNKMRVE